MAGVIHAFLFAFATGHVEMDEISLLQINPGDQGRPSVRKASGDGIANIRHKDMSMTGGCGNAYFMYAPEMSLLLRKGLLPAQNSSFAPQKVFTYRYIQNATTDMYNGRPIYTLKTVQIESNETRGDAITKLIDYPFVDCHLTSGSTCKGYMWWFWDDDEFAVYNGWHIGPSDMLSSGQVENANILGPTASKQCPEEIDRWLTRVDDFSEHPLLATKDTHICPFTGCVDGETVGQVHNIGIGGDNVSGGDHNSDGTHP